LPAPRSQRAAASVFANKVPMTASQSAVVPVASSRLSQKSNEKYTREPSRNCAQA
jgi:hypothetical protein